VIQLTTAVREGVGSWAPIGQWRNRRWPSHHSAPC
jgi:hypothetical protein